MFTCFTCKKEWPENYCPECAHTIVRPPVPPKPGSVAPPPPAPVIRGTGTKSSPGQFSSSFSGNFDPAAQETAREIMNQNLRAAKPRRCKCGSTMFPTGIRQYFQNSFMIPIPCGYKLVYVCAACRRKASLPSFMAVFWSLFGIIGGSIGMIGLPAVFLFDSTPQRAKLAPGPFCVLGAFEILFVILFALSVYTVYAGIWNRFAHPPCQTAPFKP